jgi:hypothetical protein
MPRPDSKCSGCDQTPCYLGETRLYVCALCKRWTPWCIGGHDVNDSDLENGSCDDCRCKLGWGTLEHNGVQKTPIAQSSIPVVREKP